MRHKEVTQLKRIDQQDILHREKAFMKDFKLRVVQKLQHDESVRRDVQLNLKLLTGKASPERKLHHDERAAIESLNPSEVLSKARMSLALQMTGELPIIGAKPAKDQKNR